MSLTSLLSIARSALLTQQKAMAVTSNNIANAQTPGYSRQRLDLVPADPQIGANGTLGRGVTDLGVSRARDLFSDATYRRQSGLLGASTTLHDMLSQIEGAVNEPSDTGVSAALDGMLNSFADLANNPASSAGRQLVQQAAGRFAQQLHQLDGQVKAVGQDATDRLTADVAQINSLAAKVADLNNQIQSVGTGAPELADQRDQLVDQISSLVDVRTLQRADGTVAVLAGDTMLVDGANSQTLEVRGAPGAVKVGVAGGGPDLLVGGGETGGLLQLLNVELPQIQNGLDTFAQSVVTEVNAIHQTGYTAGGATATDFFDPSGVTAGTIKLTAAVQASGDNIAAGGSAAAGDGAVALQISGLRSNGVASLGGTTLGSYYTDLAGSIGVRVQSTSQDVSVQQTLVDQADAQRSSVSGVSVEEEMTNLIAQQEAFSAAAKLVKTADDMMQAVLNMVG